MKQTNEKSKGEPTQLKIEVKKIPEVLDVELKQLVGVLKGFLTYKELW